MIFGRYQLFAKIKPFAKIIVALSRKKDPREKKGFYSKLSFKDEQTYDCRFFAYLKGNVQTQSHHNHNVGFVYYNHKL